MSAEIQNPKPKVERPPALCPECGTIARKFWGTTETYYCPDKGECRWTGKLDAFCDCCDRPMEPTASFEAYGIETHACSVCRSEEF